MYRPGTYLSSNLGLFKVTGERLKTTVALWTPNKNEYKA